MFFDYISDIHLDFWVKLTHNEQKNKRNIRNFTASILPEKPQEVLVIAGDIGHYIGQNKLLITYLREVYKTIFYVFGNHDYYLLSKQMKKTYKNSIGKANAMESLFNEMDGVLRLDGTTYERNGIIYGGCNMWYDFSYGQIALEQTEAEVYHHWWETSNDSVFHSGLPNPVYLAQQEMEKAKKVVCDVFVSHVPPIGIPVNELYADEADLSFYTFDAEPLFNEHKPSVWVSGHMHQILECQWNGINMVVNALGYPENQNSLPTKIKTYLP